MASTIKNIRIHPGIGIARVGNSDEYYIGPEAPGVVVDPGGEGGPGPNGGTYRDAENRLKRQAQRFRIYATDETGKINEITSKTPGVKEIIWRVHVRNLKAANYAFQGAYLFNPKLYRNPNIQSNADSPEERDKLIIDAGITTISASAEQPVIMAGDIFNGVGESELPGYLRFENMEQKIAHDGEELPPVKVTYQGANNIELGQLKLDDQQRLLFVPGPGKAECVTTPKIELSNPSENYDAPNGPNPADPLVNQFAYFNVPGWWDDTCGGEIDATVVFEDDSVISTRDGVNNAAEAEQGKGERNDINGGWIVTAPPKFAPHMYHVVTLLDRVYETFPESDPNRNKRTNFYRDVYPILSRACNYGWVSAQAAGVAPSTKNAAHGPKQPGNLLSQENLQRYTDNSNNSKGARLGIFNLMRQAERSTRTGENEIPKLIDTLPVNPPPAAAEPPRPASDGPKPQGNLMPKLWGTGGKPFQNQQLGNNLPNEYLSLTDWQLRRMEDWANGDFETGTLEAAIPLESYPVSEQPHALDAAALEPTIGGGFHPGIEFPYLIAYQQFFAEGFRVKSSVKPGQLAAYMSSPWQGDYWSCNIAWWPVQRPDIVFKYDQNTDTRTYQEWFRGYDAQGEPLSATDGYDQMVYAWPKLGMVLPSVNTVTDEYVTSNGQLVFQEFERDPELEYPPSVCLAKALTQYNGSQSRVTEVTKEFYIPTDTRVILSSESNGTGNFYVDVEVSITATDTVSGESNVICKHDFHNDYEKLTPLPPTDITANLKNNIGQNVKMEVVLTLNPFSHTNLSSALWLSFWPN
ncbi:LodA/GoxA family CTQ-dependent oxidase [Vibrio maritimus]